MKINKNINLNEAFNKFNNHELFHLSIEEINKDNKFYANLFFKDIFFNGISNEELIKYLNFINDVLIIESKSFFYEFNKLFKANYKSISQEILIKFAAISYSYELVSLILMLNNEINAPVINNINVFINCLYKLKLRLTKTAYNHIILNDYGTFSNKINIINKIMLKCLVYDKK